jgi:hypothetical protein
MRTMLVRELSHDTLWQLVSYGVLDLEDGHRIDSVATQLTAGLSFSRAQQYARDHTAQEAIDTDITATAEGLVPLGTSYLRGREAQLRRGLGLPSPRRLSPRVRGARHGDGHAGAPLGTIPAGRGLRVLQRSGHRLVTSPAVAGTTRFRVHPASEPRGHPRGYGEHDAAWEPT